MIKNKKDHRTYLCYKSNSGMMWHLLILANTWQYFKFSNIGLYSTSLLVDLNLQKKFCNLTNFTIIEDDDYYGKIEMTTNQSRKDTSKGGLFYNRKGRKVDNTEDQNTEKSYIESISSHSKICTEENPYYIFSKITSELENDKDYPSPDCGYEYKGELKHSHLIYKELRKRINIKMAENFIDKGNEKNLYSCYSGKIGITYYFHKFVKIKYTVFEREIADKTNENIFKLIYARYHFIEKLDDNIELPKSELKNKIFVIPLLITSCNNIQKGYPLINKVAAAGLYTCKVFEYQAQTIGSYNYRFNKEKISSDEKEKSDENKKNGAGNYFFVGEFMDKLWPFEDFDKEIQYVHYTPKDLVNHYTERECIIS